MAANTLEHPHAERASGPVPARGRGIGTIAGRKRANRRRGAMFSGLPGGATSFGYGAFLPAPVPPRASTTVALLPEGSPRALVGLGRRGAGHLPAARSRPFAGRGSGADAPGRGARRGAALGAGPGCLPAPGPARAQPHRAGPRGRAGSRWSAGRRRSRRSSTSSASAAPTTRAWWASPAWARPRWWRAWRSSCCAARARWRRRSSSSSTWRTLVAGTQLRGSFSEKLNGLKDEVRRADGPGGGLHRRDPHAGRRGLDRRGPAGRGQRAEGGDGAGRVPLHRRHHPRRVPQASSRRTRRWSGASPPVVVQRAVGAGDRRDPQRACIGRYEEHHGAALRAGGAARPPRRWPRAT